MFTQFSNKWSKLMSALPHPVRWLTTMTVGFFIVIVGIILIPLPGPGTLVILVGLTILGVELEWARQSVTAGEQWMEKLVAIIKTKFGRKPKNNGKV